MQGEFNLSLPNLMGASGQYEVRIITNDNRNQSSYRQGLVDLVK